MTKKDVGLWMIVGPVMTAILGVSCVVVYQIGWLVSVCVGLAMVYMLVAYYLIHADENDGRGSDAG